MNSIIVTGGSGGIGRCIVESLLKNYKVYNLDKQTPEKKMEGETFLRVDLTSADNINSALYSIKKETLSGFVHCAGFGGPFVDISKVTEELWDKIFQLTSKQLIYSLKKFYPNLKRDCTVDSS